LLNVRTNREKPYLSKESRLEIEHIGNRLYKIILHSGFMQKVNVPQQLKAFSYEGIEIDLEKASYFLGSQRIISANKRLGMPKWRQRFFNLLIGNEQKAGVYFNLRPERVIEFGQHIT